MLVPNGTAEGIIRINAQESFTINKLEVSFESSESYNSHYFIRPVSMSSFHDNPEQYCSVLSPSVLLVGKGKDELRFELVLPEKLLEYFNYIQVSNAENTTYTEFKFHTDKGLFYYLDAISPNVFLEAVDAPKPQHIFLQSRDSSHKVRVDVRCEPQVLRIGQPVEFVFDVKPPEHSHSFTKAKVVLHQFLKNKVLNRFENTSEIVLGSLDLRTKNTTALRYANNLTNFVSFDGTLIDNQVQLIIQDEASDIKDAAKIPLKIGNKLQAGSIELAELELSTAKKTISKMNHLFD
eukprot:CAMPEP_0204899162 /NCGR_PEP_ID=MMETSP1397-20131031/1695_1 /ASSEMBLY_ACC=CAM_ASM_000891 /TAXON_ID=49980 /ORGANISM="Climacostomum Climacostomum virens, Strain Stock W-24" /LENGTH=292 /DNA_ID=CAMNT_0052067083 /DNA_START=1 /DNA_END=879 /DNA_ORIENTATION=-